MNQVTRGKNKPVVESPSENKNQRKIPKTEETNTFSDNTNDNNDTSTSTSITNTNSDNKGTEKTTTKEIDRATTNDSQQDNEEVEIDKDSKEEKPVGKTDISQNSNVTTSVEVTVVTAESGLLGHVEGFYANIAAESKPEVNNTDDGIEKVNKRNKDYNKATPSTDIEAKETASEIVPQEDQGQRNKGQTI